ncbi:Lrp/AsnC family transcriptional regulator [Rhodanobacter sp. DHB23]|uniref:Lrp/AsnC family transcriptional regulator n=1 Tax=Rhodanobacter sp. DHB23 TaxID=2775923 RepID=UPI0017839FEE|nr:Lrp/AsnC family transcriptional regulator [Rhodanobacter sp. DHB23]MBD8871821.1 Lrp/AsnC family transcriptional regulator [Rhodanobacter sp. DHB23]
MRNHAIDGIDRKILGVLQADGRASFRELGAQVNLSPNATAERVARLQERGIITGFQANVSMEAMGFGLQVFIDVKLQPGASMEAFEQVLQSIDVVHDAVSLTGSFDARLRVACRDTAHLGELVELLRSGAGVQETSSSVICRSLDVTGRVGMAGKTAPAAKKK